MARSNLETALELAKRSTPAAAQRASRVGKKGMLLYIDTGVVPALEAPCG